MRIDKFLRLASGWLPGVDYFKEIIRRIFAKSHYQVLFALFLAVFTISCGNGQSSQKLEAMQKNVNVVTIDNSEPRRDVESKIIDAHDGCLQLFGSSFYLYGTAYGTNDGYGTANRFRVYSSPDLKRWTLAGELFKEQPDGVYYRPYVVFNPNTHKYVLWYNWYPKPWNGQSGLAIGDTLELMTGIHIAALWDGHTGVAISDTPTGPFTIVNANVQLTRTNSGDGSLFVDDDGTGYYIYTAIGMGYTVRVERLARDYLSSTGETSDVLAAKAEAPLLFRRNDLYYVLWGELCPFCTEGSEAHVFISTSPLGPYNAAPNINRPPEGALDIWAQPISNRSSPETKATIIPAQETWVAKIPMSDGPAFIWMADVWGSAPDGIKGHDLQYWSPPLKFNPENNEIYPVENALRWDITWSANSMLAGQPKAIAAGNYVITPQFTQTDPEAGNNLAWFLATSPEATNRNGALAVELAKRACEQTHYQKTVTIGTLAAAYAEAGRFDDAIATAQKACKLASESGEQELLRKNMELLELYRKHQPYHEASVLPSY